MIYRLMLQIEQGTLNIGAYTILVGQERGYSKPIIDYYSTAFALMFLLGSVLILKEHLYHGEN